SWTPTSIISAPLALLQQTPKVALDSMGNAIVIYTGLSGKKQVLKAATLPSSTAIWMRTFDASPVADQIIPQAVALDLQGVATAVFQSVKGNTYTLKGATLKQNSALWKPTNDLSTASSQPMRADLSMNGSGSGVAVSDRPSGGISNVFANIHL